MHYTVHLLSLSCTDKHISLGLWLGEIMMCIYFHFPAHINTFDMDKLCFLSTFSFKLWYLSTISFKLWFFSTFSFSSQNNLTSGSALPQDIQCSLVLPKFVLLHGKCLLLLAHIYEYVHLHSTVWLLQFNVVQFCLKIESLITFLNASNAKLRWPPWKSDVLHFRCSKAGNLIKISSPMPHRCLTISFSSWFLIMIKYCTGSHFDNKKKLFKYFNQWLWAHYNSSVLAKQHVW